LIFGIIVALCALFISSIAAWYSIAGLIAIFAASPLPIALMGGGLEIGKLVAASWLYKNWYDAPKFIKYYLTFAVIVLMLITSLGIFGFLSKSHIESNINVGDTSIQLKILEQREQITKDRLAYLLKKAGDDPERIARSTDRAIQETQNELIDLQKEKMPLLKEQNALLAEIGPLKYIAEMIYGKNAEEHFDSAVRFVIILLIFVFDPLAVLLVIAANYTLQKELSPKSPTENVQKENKKTKRKVDLTSLGPIPMTKEELEKKINLFER
jgi:hypothetical protein